MTDCYSVHLIKLIVMTFHLFTYVASVFSDERKKTGGKHLPIILEVLLAVQKVTYSHRLFSPFHPEVVTAVERSRTTTASAPSLQHASECNMPPFHYRRATCLKNPEV